VKCRIDCKIHANIPPFARTNDYHRGKERKTFVTIIFTTDLHSILISVQNVRIIK